MVITYYGLSCFKIQSGETTLVFDLPGRLPGFKPPRFHFDIALESHGHPGHCGAREVSGAKEAFVVSDPGEYEIKGIHVQGFKTFHDSFSGKKYGLNTSYVVQIENIKLCFMGDYGEKDLRPETKEGINKIDILFVPIGGGKALDAQSARNLINQLDPAIAVPMHYSPGSEGKAALKDFLADFGLKDVKALEKLSIKKKDIGGDKGAKIIVFSPI